jgi:hypothetical protein
MSTSRSSKIEQLFKSLRKHYKTVPSAPERSVLDHIVYASILEETTFDQADEALAKLLQAYVDYNEIRVTTAVELAELIIAGPVGVSIAQRLKRILQSIYETRYSFDIEDVKKGNLSKSVEFLSGLKGMTPFVSNYVNQNALGGHAIGLGNAAFELAVIFEIITEAEASKKSIPGLERTIPKSKGLEFFQLIHQLAVAFAVNPKNATVAAVFKDLKVTYKPPRPAEKEKDKEKVAAAPAAPQVKADKALPVKGTKKGAAPVQDQPPAEPVKPGKEDAAKVTKKKAAAPAKEKPAKAKPATKSKPAAPPPKAAKTPAKKAPPAKAKKPETKGAKSTRTLTKKKPR